MPFVLNFPQEVFAASELTRSVLALLPAARVIDELARTQPRKSSEIPRRMCYGLLTPLTQYCKRHDNV